MKRRDLITEPARKRLSIVEGIAVGEQAARARRVTSHAAARKRLSRWLE